MLKHFSEPVVNTFRVGCAKMKTNTVWQRQTLLYFKDDDQTSQEAKNFWFFSPNHLSSGIVYNEDNVWGKQTLMPKTS